ncbi:hypothetical protein [Prosthecobacter sp.]|uniref:hypothetical protein n=1 Tax=Prosthecobacter sp. TaxID=1965333 RepID=UPI003782F094
MQRRDGCKGKIRHLSRGGASKAIKAMQKPGLEPYRCKQCQGWHVGHASVAEGIQDRLDRLIGPDPKTQTSRP